ncbi:MAG: hypothetical protein ACU0AY_01080 [Marinibacterium profundimaris]
MLRSSVLAFALIALTAIPAAAQLVGNDTAPGDSCTDKPAGATRMTADPDGDGGSVTLICDGTVWQVEANDIQDGLRRVAVETDPCTTIGQLAQSSAGDLLVCKNAGDITGESCADFDAGAISLNDDGSIHVCMN